MPSLHTHGVEVVAAYVVDDRVLRAYLGDELVYDDTGATIVDIRPAYAASNAPDVGVGRGARPLLDPAVAAASAPMLAVWVGARVALLAAVAESIAPTGDVAAAVLLNLAPAVSESVARDIAVGKTVVELPPARAASSAPTLAVSAAALVDFTPAQSSATAPALEVRAGAVVALGVATSKSTAPAGEVVLSVEYSDSFDRANGALGASWATMGTWSPPVINGNKAQGGTSAPTNQGRAYAARYALPLHTDTQEVEFAVATPTGTAALGIGGGGFVRANSSGDRVDIVVTNNSVHIMTRIGSNTVDQASATGLPAIAAGTVFKLTAAGNVYTAYRAGVQVVQWTDSGGLIAIGSGTRQAGILCVEQKNQLAQSSFGWAIDNWHARG